MLTKKYSEETIAIAVIYAARKASGTLKKSWNKEAFSILFDKALELENSQLLQECFRKLYDTYSGCSDLKDSKV